MLVLSRKVGEELVLNFGGAIARVTILAAYGNNIRLGIAAPLSIDIDRAEIAEAKAAAVVVPICQEEEPARRPA